MLEMILKMSGITGVYVALTFLMWKNLNKREMTVDIKIAVGCFFGLCSIFSTHFGIDYGDMLLNVRDIGPMAAGLFFDPVAGIIAGLIGGIERYYAGAYLGIASFTKVACSVSTCLAGFVAAFMRIVIFKGKRPSTPYAFFMGAIMEVFHMYAVFITHRGDLRAAMHVVSVCAVPMIFFTGAGLALIAASIRHSEGEFRNPLMALKKEEMPVSQTFQIWLFGVASLVLSINFALNFTMQSQAAIQNANEDLFVAAKDISDTYDLIHEESDSNANMDLFSFHVGGTGTFDIFDTEGRIIAGDHMESGLDEQLYSLAASREDSKPFVADYLGERSFCSVAELTDGTTLLLEIPLSSVFAQRNAMTYETFLANILLFAAIYVLISLLVQKIVVDNLELVTDSLHRIADGNLDEEVKVYASTEFNSLSNDINHTVTVLKGYIQAAEKRMEQELLLARTIQESALPTQFDFSHGGFEIYASMYPAKEVGGDFYDFFFVDTDKLAMVMADVSGKGIPASLFMMRSKSTIRGLAETGTPLVEIFNKTNKQLCEGNEACMFVTAWMGIVDLRTGDIRCVNAGHEYPAVRHRDGSYELLKDKHCIPLGVMEDTPYKEYNMHLEPGDCLFVYTDGIPESINTDKVQFGTDRMLNVLNENKDLSMKDILSAAGEAVIVFKGDADQFDDETMMGFRYNGMGDQQDDI